MKNNKENKKSALKSLGDSRKRARALGTVVDQMFWNHVINEDIRRQIIKSCNQVTRESILIRDLFQTSRKKLACQKTCNLSSFINRLELDVEALKNKSEVAHPGDKEKTKSSSNVEDWDDDFFQKRVCRELKQEIANLVELRKTGHKLAVLDQCSELIWTIRRRVERIEDELKSESRNYIWCQLRILSEETSALKKRFESGSDSAAEYFKGQDSGSETDSVAEYFYGQMSD